MAQTKKTPHEVRLAEIRLAEKQTEIERAKLGLAERRQELIAQGIVILVYVAFVVMAANDKQVDTILGRPLTCALPLLIGYYFGKMNNK